MVVGAEAETAFVTVQSPTAGNRNAFPGDFLIDHRFLVPVFIPARPDDEVALFIDSQLIRALEDHPDLLRIRSGRDDPVVFQIAVLSVVDEIDSGVDAGVADSGKVGNGSAPLSRIVADEIVTPGVLRDFARNASRRVCTG